MKQEELNKILEEHKLWLNGKGGTRADLQGANLLGANLEGTDLRGADLEDADLQWANFKNANLKGADLRYAILKSTNLQYADLKGANLQYADLQNTNLKNTNLEDANLRLANLRLANLQDANLEGANLEGASLKGANLKNVKGRDMICPEEGAFIGFKKCYNKIVELEILEDSKRSSATSGKCRCDKAKVLNITSLDGLQEFKNATSDYDVTFKYNVGEIVSVENFNDNRWIECAEGIHFFITRQEAIEY
jgi:hypothetical protein